MKEVETNATSLEAPALLEAAAKLIERALIKLDMRQTECAHCDHTLYANRSHAKAYEMLTNMPDRLRTASLKLSAPASASKGYATAVLLKRERE